jgi:hypothetical protein
VFRIAAYGWEKGFSKQVVYRAVDGHIHELFFSAGGIEPGFWDHADLTQITGAPPPASIGAFSGYEWEPLASKQVVYTTDDGHLHELFVQVGDFWSHADLTQMAGAPPTFDAFSFAGYQWRAAGTKQVVYVGADSHIHELFVPVGGSWSNADLTALTGGTPLFVDQVSFAGYEWDFGGSKQVVSVTLDGHVQELFVPMGGSWSHVDLTQITGAPTASQSLGRWSCFAWEAGRSKQVAYLRTDGHIHELFAPVGGLWSHADLTQMAGAPPASRNSQISGYEWKAGDSKQVVYRTDDGRIHELFVPAGGSWSHADLTQITNCPMASSPIISGYDWASSKQVVYLTEDGHIHELSVALGDSWSHTDLTQITGSPPAA